MSQTIINDIPPYTQATAVASQTVFMTTWTANFASDVVVYQTPAGNTPNDATQILPYPSGYTVTFVGGLNQVQVTLTNPANAGDIITITRQTPANRENLYNNTNFQPSMLNNDFGILTLVDQQAQLVNQLIGPRYNYSAVITDVVDTILPILGANQVWIKNSSNTAIIAATITGGGTGGGVNVGAQNELAWYATNGNVLSGLLTQNNSVLVTSSTGQPNFSQVLPASLLIPSPQVTGGIYDHNSNTLLAFTSTANAVNYLTITNNATGFPPSLAAHGSDTNVGLQLITQGTGPINFIGEGGLTNIAAFTSTPSAVNYFNFINNVTNANPAITAQGSDANITLQLNGKGTGGIYLVGVGTNSAAVPGQVGELISNVIPSGSAVTSIANAASNLTSIQLTAGDYDLYGNINWQSLGASPNGVFAWISTTSATLPDPSLFSGVQLGSGTIGGDTGVNAPFKSLSLAATTTVYISGYLSNGGTNGTMCGGIYARRRR